jgi:hypothetical protein
MLYSYNFKFVGYFDNSVSQCEVSCHPRCQTCSTFATTCLTCDSLLFRSGPTLDTCSCIAGIFYN